MNPKTTGIVFQGLQNEMCHPSGALYEVVSEQLSKRHFVENMLALLNEAVSLEIKCYFVPITFTPDYRELKDPVGIMGLIKEKGAFRKGTPGVEPIEDLKPLLSSIRVLMPKRGLCAFGSTNLADVLREDGIETVAVCGLLTNMCVESTARTAYDLRYKVVVLHDCTATKSADEQQASERFVFPLLGQVLAFRDFLSQLHQEKADVVTAQVS